MDGDAQRTALEGLMAAHDVGFAALSRVIGRNPAYLQQYVRRGTPRALAEVDRARLAAYFGVDETVLGGPAQIALIAVPRLDIGASAGPGRMAEDARARRPAMLAPSLLRELGVRAEAASVIRVEGDSMEPTLADGDEILVDRDRREVRGGGGIFVLRIDGAILVKRLRACVGGVEVASDNPGYATRVCARGDVEVIGRVAWMSRALV
ncbi:S24 family peptidase [Sphingomonas hengshuiensis]|uniref:Phage repressor protein n=1 Tax=Sphingomonas hengshuiensis TaxID=1609977 RepID=A0A7U4J667_9SPHN|nr:S24 family peptidase [Sphingomonas hengshuiensis]AJP70983.1 phage repressor protein [Sphingomonas hengshuiensis]